MTRVVVFAILILLKSSVVASGFGDVAECRVIVSDSERLACFDKTTEQLCKTESCNEGLTDRVSVEEDSEPNKEADETFFGLTKKTAEAEIEKVESTIKDIKLASYGKHVFVLDNGQVWMENEPGRKKVRNKQQNVVIRKKGLRYIISFESGVSLSVHRVE